MADLDVLRSGPSAMDVRLAGQVLPLAGGQLNNSINERATATIEVDLAHLAPVDYSGPVTITRDPEATPVFTGHVVRAAGSAPGITRMQAESGRDLMESRVGYLRTTGVGAAEAIHLVARIGGYGDDRLSIEGLDQAPLEAMVIEMPIIGVRVSDSFSLLGVEFQPWATPNPFSEALDADPARWGGPTATARVYGVGNLMFNVEQEAQSKIQTAVDALLTTAVYALSRDTRDQELPFERDRLLARPAVVPLIFAQGIASHRRWIHELNDHSGPQGLSLEDHYRQWGAVLSAEPPTSVVSAMRSLRDAADDTRPSSERCHHLWSALEYYAANAKPPKVVSKQSFKAARGAVKELGLPPAEVARLLGVLDGANQAPLMARVRHQASADGAPTSEAEWNHLAALRDARNRTVHGSVTESVSDDDLRWGVSIAARFILYHWSRSTPG